MKLVIFGINLTESVYPLKRFLQNLALGREFQVRTLMPNFVTVGLKMWECSPQNRQNWYFFVINLPKRGIHP